MADTCVYTLQDKDGTTISLAGRAAFKTYLFEGGLEHLFPKLAVPALISGRPAFSRPATKMQVISNLFERLYEHSEVSANHSANVAKITAEFARYKHLDAETINALIEAASLHDIGKIEVPSDLLEAPRGLTVEERSKVGQHAKNGADILKGEPIRPTSILAALYHHSQGSTVPGLTEQENNIVQTVKIADVFDALVSSDRPYKAPYSRGQALLLMLNDRGHFDPAMLRDFINMQLSEHTEALSAQEKAALRDLLAVSGNVTNTRGFNTAIGLVNEWASLLNIEAPSLAESDRATGFSAAGLQANKIIHLSPSTFAKLESQSDSISFKGAKELALQFSNYIADDVLGNSSSLAKAHIDSDYSKAITDLENPPSKQEWLAANAANWLLRHETLEPVSAKSKGIIQQIADRIKAMWDVVSGKFKVASSVDEALSELAGYSATFRDVGGPMFSRQNATAAQVLREFVKDDEFFKYRISFKRDIADVMAEVAPKFKYLPEQDDRYGDGFENQVRVFESPSGSHLLIKEHDGKVWVDVSGSQHGEKTGALYFAVGNYAFNTGKVFIDDPTGVSRDAVIRRPAHMLSLALRFGTTRFLGISENFDAESRKYGERPLRLGQGYEADLNNLIERNIASLYKAIPELSELRYDFQDRRFEDSHGRSLAPDWAERYAATETARAINAGESTIRRGVFLKSIISSSGAEKSAILEDIRRNGWMAQGKPTKGLFSRPGTQQLLREFAKYDEVFKHPVSDSTTLEGVMADVAPMFERKPVLDRFANSPNGEKNTVYKSVDGNPVVIKEADGKVWIDVSNLKSGDMGGAIYAAVGNYARNAGLKFIDDPAGVSDYAILRRPMHMLSLALRFGSTDFLDVSYNFETESRKRGLVDLDWRKSSETAKMARLLARNIYPVLEQLPDLKDYYYDFRTDQFKNDKLGGILPDDWADQRAVREDARRAKIGESTVRRVLFLKSLASSQGEERSGLLEKYRADGRLAEGVPLERIFSRQSPEAGITQLSESEAKQHLVDNFGVGIENLISSGVLHFTDGKQVWPEAAKNGARGDEEAVYINGKVYVDLAATGRERLNAVLLHEIGEHYGLRRMLGPQAYHSLQQQITNRAKIAGSKAGAVWSEVKTNYPELEEGGEAFVSEVIAKLGETNSKAPWYRRLMSQIKAFLMKMGLARGLVAGTITEADMHGLLVASLRSAAIGKEKDKAHYFGGEPAMASRQVEAEPEIAYSRPSVDTLKQIILEDEYGEPTLISQAVRKLDENWDAIAKQRFASMSVRQMVEYAAHIMPNLDRYERFMQDREAEKSAWFRKASRLVSEIWKKLPAQELSKLAKVMHDSTLDDIDASAAWTGVREYPLRNPDGGYDNAFYAYTQETLTDGREAALREAAEKEGAKAVNNKGYAFKTEEQAKKFLWRIENQVKKQREERSRLTWPDKNIERYLKHREVAKAYEELSDKSKTVYFDANKMHDDIFSARLETLEDRIGEAVVNGAKRAALLAQVRATFESGSLKWYYAPLSRFGNEWLYGINKNGEKVFSTFKSPKAKEKAKDQFIKGGGQLIGSGTSLRNLDKLEGQAASDSFVLDIQKKIDMVKDLDPNVGSDLKDQIYQMYLSTLPDVSMRHNAMHRSGMLGFEEDAMQAFSNALHHGSSQLANMKYGREMRKVLTDHINAVEMAEKPILKQYASDEIDAAEMLKENWDALTEENTLEDMLRNKDELDEPVDSAVLNKAIQLRNRFYGMDAAEAKVALNNVIGENQAAISNANLILPQDTKRAKEVLDELLLTYEHMVNYNSSDMDRVASAFNQANFVGMLGFGLSSGLVNLLQTPGVAMPVAAGKFGVSPTLREFGKAFNEFMSALKNQKYDVDGNTSISAVLQDRLDKARGEARFPIEDEIDALETFKDSGDISRTRTFDIMGIGQEGATYGGRFHDFALKAGWMFHHGERLNREVTLLASYRLARQGGEDHKRAIQYARYVNNRAHLDYSSENAARIFRGPLAKIALQFKKYQQGMLFLWTKTAIDAWKTLKPEQFPDTADGKSMYKAAVDQQRESRRTFFALIVMQTSLGGALGLPMMGMVGVVYKMIADAFGDDDEPHDLEKDLRLGLAKVFGDTVAESLAKGVVNTFTPINLASRLDQADVFFKEPLKELEGRDAAQAYVAEVFGPTGGSFEKAWQGLSLLQDGQIMRGIEQLSPKFVGDITKAARFATEGARTLDNMPLKDMSAFESFIQAMGFGSSELERRYAERGFAKGEESAIKETRTKIMREAAWAKVNGEIPDMIAIREWNLKHPEKKILAENISASVKGIKESVKNRQERGYVVDPKLEYLYDENEIMD